ncbi:MAG: acyl-ACP thioesterase [Spirochaetaceae bacterium]|jgi:acyl-ACP thioesterase|nr:acyl-ACP thioesterase [Spirochaetaceae bacterium]
MDIYSEQLSIRFADVDQSDSLTIAATFDLFQEAANTHAELLGVGRDMMQKTGQVWILSRLSVFMERRPRYREQVTIRSWPRGSNKLFAVRDYDIRTAGQSSVEPAVVRGRSAWLIVDLEKHRPLRPQTLVEQLPPNEGMDALPGPNSGNEPPPSLASRFSADAGKDFPRPAPRRAAYSDIDYNGHVNNARYIQWIQDLLDPSLFAGAKQIRLDINYLSEVRYGETIGLYTAAIDGSCADTRGAPAACTSSLAVEGRRKTEEAEGAPVFRAELRMG